MSFYRLQVSMQVVRRRTMMIRNIAPAFEKPSLSHSCLIVQVLVLWQVHQAANNTILADQVSVKAATMCRLQLWPPFARSETEIPSIRSKNVRGGYVASKCGVYF
jgi:hypothetical protein